jgi:signal transduction histidine kinase
LLLATLAPTALGFAAFGFLAHEVARRSLEDELGRRLSATAVAVAVQILPEQILAIGEGDESSRTHANIRHRISGALDLFDLRRVAVLATDMTGRGDTQDRVALGAKAHEFLSDRVEITSAASGRPAASPLFEGRDGRPYKRAYAAVGGANVTGFVVVEGDADFFAPLAGFRRRLLLWGGVSLVILMVFIVWIARRITDPLGRLAAAADRIGRGDLENAVTVETRDELGQLAVRLDQMRAALRARDERTQMMLAGIAHEVRNPLGGLELFAGLLREGLAGQPERLDEVRRIEREIGHLGSVVNDFLDYARRPALQVSHVDLAAMLTEVAEMAAAPGALVEVDPPGAFLVDVDASQMRRALLNLARNARAAAGPSGRVVLSVRRVPGAGPRGVRVEVRDDGPGVSVALRETIFQPFFTTREKGTGLGLAFVREIVRDHGGEIAVTQAPEGGACFRVEI